MNTEILFTVYFCRWQSEGSRFDSDAVPDPVRENAHNPDSHLGESKDEKYGILIK